MQSALLLQSFLRGLPPTALLLDLGCGTGRGAAALARAGLRVVGLDADFDALETARFLAQDAEGAAGEGVPGFVAGDARALPFAAARFDAVLCEDVLHWSEDAATFVAAWGEAWRVLKPGGIFAARLRALEASPGATPLENGRHRGASGAEWFLAGRALLEACAADGEWLEAPVFDGGESVRFLLRKGRAGSPKAEGPSMRSGLE